MNYVIIIISIILIVAFLLLYPFKIIIHNENNYLFINFSNFLNLKINLFVLLDNNHNDEIKKQINGFKIFKKLKFKQIDINLEGLNFDYRLNGGYFGLLYALFGLGDNILSSNDIKFNYNLKYLGDKSIEFKTIFRARLISVFKVMTSF